MPFFYLVLSLQTFSFGSENEYKMLVFKVQYICTHHHEPQQHLSTDNNETLYSDVTFKLIMNYTVALSEQYENRNQYGS